MNGYSGEERRRLLLRVDALENERSTWLSHWEELARYVSPRSYRYLGSEKNKGEKKHQAIINGTATRALRTLAAGMQAGVTSPARPWFKLTLPDASLADWGPAKAWLWQVEERLRAAFAKSNFYRATYSAYRNLGLFGTSATWMDEDAEDDLRLYSLPTGQYALANSARLQVDTCSRRYSMTVAQLVRKFCLGPDGQPDKARLERLTGPTLEHWKAGRHHEWVEVLHVLEPNAGFRAGALGPRGMAWCSVWFEANAPSDTHPPLHVGGYQESPLLAPRWDVDGEDVYGSSPGMDALGDVKALQVLEKKKGSLVAKLVDPPMRGPSSLEGSRASLLPGDVTYADVASGGQKFEPAHEVHPQAVTATGMELREHERRINELLFADLWLMLSSQDGTMTAREVAARHEEKLMQLGPVTERLQDELLDPAIDRAFSILLRQGQLPPPPEELSGQPLKVEFIGILAQAQKLAGTAGVERLGQFVVAAAAVQPQVLRKLDWNATVDAYADMLGVPPTLVRPTEAVQKELAAEQAALAKAQATEQAASVAATGKTLSETKLEEPSALSRLMQVFGASAPQGGSA